MPITPKTRSLLKAFFETLKKPTQQDFADFIDSVFNINEDSKALVKGVEFALNRRGEGNLNDPAIVTSMLVNIKKFDFWVMNGGTAPRGGDTSTLVTGDWLIAKVDGANTGNFGDTNYWWIPPTVLKTAIQTLTNKRIIPRTNTLSTGTALTISTDDVDAFSITALDDNITITTTGTPSNFERFTLRIKTASSTVRTLTFDTAKFETSTAALPTSMPGTRLLSIDFEYNNVNSKWGCKAVHLLAV